MFKKTYTAVAVFLLTLLLTVVGGIGAKHLFLFLADTDWLVVSSVVCGTILLAILSDLCYNYFVKHRETATDALKGFKDDLEAVWQIIVKFFTPPLLKKTLTYVFVFLVLLSFCIGSAVVFRGFVEAYDKVTRFDEKIKDIGGNNMTYNDDLSLPYSETVYLMNEKLLDQQVEYYLNQPD